ncbi:MAG: methionine biosynthesis protein MetW [Proteobacteria bacterium]|nr:methionine biosynthesis protein MetW [Pseudomonadota bacterium]MBU1610452.1 methionine biosynthesis protein MetW [Pseudomonadota bacterium]
MRFDLQVIASWIEPGSRVLDLGCGRGSLLGHLRDERQVRGTGIERDEDKVLTGIGRGLTVVHGDMNEEVRDYPDNAFDYVILSQALMQVFEAEALIKEMLRVGRRAVVSFPNFSHWRHRLQMLFKGRAPVSRELPYEWFDTPNIRVITLRDFKRFCEMLAIPIRKECAIRTHHHEESGKIVRFKPEIFATYGIYLLGQPGEKP